MENYFIKKLMRMFTRKIFKKGRKIIGPAIIILIALIYFSNITSSTTDVASNFSTNFKERTDVITNSAKGVIRKNIQNINYGNSTSNIDADAVSGDYTIVNNNIPLFTDEEKQNTQAFEYYSDLDPLGRCGVAYANICKEIMPTEERGEIGMIKPTGWHTVKYDCVDGKYLYNRCHLIAFCLTGENANEKNLITGTRYFNTQIMLPFETQVAQYIDLHPDNHVLYRVTPVFSNDNLVADGVYMEAWSVEDNGTGICFFIFANNYQPGIIINYENGESQLK